MAKNLGKMHQSRIKRRAIKNPIEAFFLGGFDLLPKTTQKKVMKELSKK